MEADSSNLRIVVVQKSKINKCEGKLLLLMKLGNCPPAP